MTSKTRWYFEEKHDLDWIAEYYGYNLSRYAANDLMEKRKAESPKAVLRLVCEVTTTRDYRERNAE